MGQVLHGSATTTAAVRRALQRSQESLRTLAKRHGINPKTVAKWKKRNSVADLPTGPKEPTSTVLSIEEEAIIVAFRRHTLLPLDDCLYALQATIPHLTRSSLHRCLQRHGISRLPEVEGDKPDKRKFKAYPIGYFHIDIAEVRTKEGKLHLFVAIDRTSKFAFVALHEKADRPTAVCFLEALIAAVPYRLHTVLTDNGIQFADLPRNRNGWTARYRVHRFDQICRANGIEHRLTKPNHPWTNGQVERMNRTLKEATVKRYYYETHQQLRSHLADFVTAYNFGRRLKTLKGLTPYEHICKIWTNEPDRFILDPIHQNPGLNSSRGGLSTKIHAVVDQHGLPVRLLLTPGQASDKTTFPLLIENLALARDVVADRGFFARSIIDLIEAGGATAHIPSQSNVRIRRVVDRDIYRKRNLVERFFNKLKHFRRIATRFDKLARNFLAAVLMAAIRLWTRAYESTT